MPPPDRWTTRTAFPVQALAFQRHAPAGALAVATSANFGLYPTRAGVGGRLTLSTFAREEAASIDTAAAPTDLAWSRADPYALLVSFADGSLAAYACRDPAGWSLLSATRVGRADLSAVAASALDPHAAAISSWDGRVRLLAMGAEGVLRVRRTLHLFGGDTAAAGVATGHELHGVAFSPENPALVATASADGRAYVLDARAPLARAAAAAGTLHHGGGECMDVDWASGGSNTIGGSGSDSGLLCVAGSDGMLSLWDARRCGQPLTRVRAHSWGVRRAHFAPPGLALALRRRQNSVAVLSCSFDTTTVLLRFSLSSSGASTAPPKPQLLHQFRHTEFAIACAASPCGSLIASGGWDRLVAVSAVSANSPSSRL